MARATTKIDLISIANEQLDKLWKLIDSINEEQQNATFFCEMATAGKESHWSRDKNLRDMLVHLYEWHQLLPEWINANRNGIEKSFLPPPYNWKTYPQMNVDFWEKHQKTPLPKAKEMLQSSHNDVVTLLETFSNEELFAKKSLAWTGTSTLGAYCASATSSHYDWAIKKVKMYIKLSKK